MSNFNCPHCQFPNAGPEGSAGAAPVCGRCGKRIRAFGWGAPPTRPGSADEADAPTLALPAEPLSLEDGPEEPTLALPPERAPKWDAVADASAAPEPRSRRPREDRPDEARGPEQPARQWYYEREDEVVGPVTEKELRRAATNETLSGDARVWTEGMDDWSPAFEALPEVFDEPDEGGHFWGVQRTIAVVLATIAVASVAGLGAVAASKSGPKVVAVQADKPQNALVAPRAEKRSPKTANKDTGPPADPNGALTALVAAAKGGPPDDRVKAVKALEAQGAAARGAVPALIDLLDDADDRVRRAAAGALEAIGPPAREDLGAVERALAGTRPRAKVYALQYYATTEKARQPQLKDLVAALDAEEPETREEAVRAVGHYGPDCKPEALRKLFEKLLDKSPAVNRVAERVLISFTPFEGSDRDILIENLTNPNPALRYISVRLLTPHADDTTALSWFRPLLSDPEAEIREVAIAAIAQRGAPVRSVAPVFLKLTADEKLTVRLAAIRGLGDIGGGPEVPPALARFLDPKADTDSRIRSTTVQTLLRLERTTPATDVPVLELLLKEPEPAVRAAALSKLVACGDEAAPLLPQISESLRDPDSDVRGAALKVVAAIGPKAADLAPRVAELVLKKNDPGGTVGPPPGPAGQDIAERVTRSAVWISAQRRGREAWIGSGVLVDRKARLILTNYHVGTPGYEFVVFFPYKRDGKLETAPDFYLENAATLSRTGHAQVGRVVAADPGVDLSVIQFAAAPPSDALAIPFAAESAKPGQALHTVGCSGAGAGTLWRYSPGSARAVFDNDVLVDGVQRVKCKMLETTMPINSGDSGSAVTNDRGELVGLNFGAARNKSSISYAIDLTVVKAAVDVGAGRVGLRPTPGVAQPALAPAGPADSVQKLALDALARLETSGAEELGRLLDKKVSREIREGACDRLGQLGPALPDEGQDAPIAALLVAAKEDAALRPKIADALITFRGDRASAALRGTYGWDSTTKKRKAGAPVDYHLWIVTDVIPALRVKTLSEKEKMDLLKALENWAGYDPNKECKEAAKNTRDKLKPLLVPMSPKK